MSPSEQDAQDEQPIVTVRDYRPSLHHNSSSSPPESTDEEKYQFGPVEPVKPCPFANVSRWSKFGRPYTTRHNEGVHKERPFITTLLSPFKLRCWSINGPDESGDPDARREIVYEDEHTTVRMKDIELLYTQWELLNMRPGPKARVGKISPLQKRGIKPLDAPRLVQPDPRRNKRLSVSKSQIRIVDDMLNAATRFVEEPSSLSDSSQDSEDKLDFTFKSSTESSDSSHINFCLRTSSEASTSSEESREDQVGHFGRSVVTSEACGQEPSSSHPEETVYEEQVLALSRRVAQLTALTASLQRELSTCNSEKKQFEEQLCALQPCPPGGCAPPSSRRSATNADSPTEPISMRRSWKRKCTVKEEERLRMELMEQKQCTTQMQIENERLLGVILRLKCEMELEHDLNMRSKKNAVAELLVRRRERRNSCTRSSRASRESKRNGWHMRRWLFGRSKSHKSKKNNSS